MKNYLRLGAALLFISVVNGPLNAQTRQIDGVVTDEASAPVYGAVVGVKNLPVSATTDTSGHFVITVPDSVKFITVQLLGYTDVNYPVSDHMAVTLKTDAVLLKETVVMALGVSKEKKSLGYAVSTVGAEDIARSGEQNVIQALSSKAAGIQVTSSGGTPGASSKVTIRGNQTFSGNNQPLIVVDGVPIDNTTYNSSAGDYPFNANLSGVNNANRALDINPDDIESVTVLKGPAAAALYGSRAGTGALIYTTKKGRYKKGLGVTFGTSVEYSKVNKLPEQQFKYAQGNWVGASRKPTYQTSDAGPDNMFGTGDDVSAGTPRSWGPTIESLGKESFKNAENFYRTGKTYNTVLSVDGGTDKTMYRFSYSNLDQSGIIENSYLKRNTVRLTADHSVTDKLKVGTTISFANTRTRLPQNGSNLSGVMLSLMRAPASADLRNWQFSNGFNNNYFSSYDNPYYTIRKNPFDQNVNRVFGNTYLNYNPLSWLNVTYRLGIDEFSENNRQVYAVSSNGDDNQARYGQVNYGNSNQFQVYSDLLVTAKKEIAKDLNASLTLGNNIWHSDYKSTFARGRDLSIPDFYNLNNAAERYSSNSQTTIRTYAGFFDLALDYKGMVYVNVTGRNDWSSTFGNGKNNFFYPSVNGALIISEMVKLPTWFSFAKVRASYAESGIAPPAYSSKTYYGAPVYTDGFTDGITSPYLGVNGYAISNTLGDPNLQPERVKGREFGADLRFFGGRLNLDVTRYYQKTTGILLSRPIAPSSGFTALYSNSGEMENKGWELILTATPVKTKDFSWDISVNWQKNISKVLKLADGVEELNIESAFNSMGSYAIVGQPYGAFYGTKYQYSSDGKMIINPATGLPYIDPKTQNLGNPYPNWLGGIRNTLNYKKLSFTFLFDIRNGGKIWNGTKQRMNNVGTSIESEDRANADGSNKTFVIDGVVSNGVADEKGYYGTTGAVNTKTVDAERYWRNYKGDNGGAVEGAIEDGGWVRLRDISLTYRLVSPKIKKYIQYVDLSVTGRNVWLKTKYTGVDPETSLTGAGSNLQGYDYFNNPGTKSILFGIKVGF
ncbi:MAG: SusC/RagA family TonB-linked outer membrane protein [bacterium]|nr:SusC/RagA family TonB-linked outer membrane protein [bacterium]